MIATECWSLRCKPSSHCPPVDVQGYLPSPTYSLHYLPSHGFSGAVDRCGAAKQLL